MSAIIDALRRGRVRRRPQQIHTTQTDAVLQTLGYGRVNPTPLQRLKRAFGYLVVAATFVAVVWGAVAWLLI